MHRTQGTTQGHIEAKGKFDWAAFDNSLREQMRLPI